MPKKCLIYVLLYTGTGGALFFTWIEPRTEDSRLWLYFLVASVLNILTSVSTMKCLALLVIAPWYAFVQQRKQERKPASTRRYPLISVLIPAWNEEVGLVATVKTVLNTSYPHAEIVVVNDGSTDRSDQQMQVFLRKYQSVMGRHPRIPIVYVYQANGGKGAALNTAITASHGEILVTIDADCVMAQEYLVQIARAFDDPQVMAVSGCIKIGNRRTLLGVVQAMEYAMSLYARRADTMLDTIYVVGGACGAFRRSVFQQLGGYSSTHLTEDLDISFRLRRTGMRIAYAPEAIVYTEGASSLRGLMKQRVRWVRGRFETFRSYQDLLFSRKKGQHKILTWFFLPLVAFNDWSSILRISLRLGLYLYYVLTGTFPVIALSATLTTLITLPALLNDKDYRRLAWLAPIAWALFLIPSGIEFYAVVCAIWGMLRRKNAVWQRWQRQGVFDKVPK